MTFDEWKKANEQRASHPRKPIHHVEDDLQKDCVSWFRGSYPELAPLLFHPNNEAYFGGHGKSPVQRARAGARAKDMGVVPGVADLVLLYPANGYHALLIEMKTRIGRQADSQKEWQKVVEAHGYKYVICRSRIDFHKLIAEYTGIRPIDQDTMAARRLFGRDVKVRTVKKL